MLTEPFTPFLLSGAAAVAAGALTPLGVVQGPRGCTSVTDVRHKQTATENSFTFPPAPHTPYQAFNN